MNESRSTLLLRILRETLSPVRLAIVAVHVLLSIIPDFFSGWVRSRAYRLVGLDVSASAFLMGNLRFRVAGADRYQHLHVGSRARISTDVTINCDDSVTIGDNVTISPYTRIYTSTHEVGPSSERCIPALVTKPVVIEAGAWLALGVIVLPGVTIGHGTVVCAGAVVNTDLPPNSLAGGVPARVLRALPIDGRDTPESQHAADDGGVALSDGAAAAFAEMPTDRRRADRYSGRDEKA